MVEEQRLTFKPVLDKAYDDDITTIAVQAALIKSPKDITKVMKILNTTAPIPKLQHLKRVKKDGSQFWVVLVECTTGDIIPAKRVKLSETSTDLYAMLGDIKNVDVPAEPPMTRTQFELCKKYWPVNFHPERHIEKLLVEDPFTDDERSWHGACMRKVLEEHGRLNTNVAIVGDPSRRVVVATGADQLEKHPLGHAEMEAIEAVASLQRGPRDEGDLSYLCTGWDVYLAVEPCPMCAMALVHSRVARLFFAKRCLKVGAIVSTCRVPFLKSLNHHYQVFEVIENT